MSQKMWTVCLAGLLAVGAVGCSGTAIPTATVQGKVTFDDKPVTDAKVQLQHAETGNAAVATVDGEGKYSISTPIHAGKYSAIVVPNDEAPAAGSVATPPKPKEHKDIPEKYRQVATSGFTTTINKGENTFDLPMKSK